MPLHQEIHLRAKSRAWFFTVEIGKKGIVFAIDDAPGVHAIGKESRERGLAHAQRPLDGDVPRRLEGRRFGDTALWSARHGARL
jgi:hypothetical protein